MAPLENGGFQPSVWAGDRSRPIDSLMRALLYVAQQVGRPLSEADVRRLAAVPAAGRAEASASAGAAASSASAGAAAATAAATRSRHAFGSRMASSPAWKPAPRGSSHC